DPVFWAHYHGRPDWFGSTIHTLGESRAGRIPLVRKSCTPGKDYVESLVRQVEMESDLLRRYFKLYPAAIGWLGEGAGGESVYRGAPSASEFEELRWAGWWAAKLLPSSQPQRAALNLTHAKKRFVPERSGRFERSVSREH